jgi:hypothetical protein
VTGTLNITLPPMRIALQGSVVPRGRAVPNAGAILALVLVWMLVLAMPAAVWEANLPPEVQALVDAYDGILANMAVSITLSIFTTHK